MHADSQTEEKKLLQLSKAQLVAKVADLNNSKGVCACVLLLARVFVLLLETVWRSFRGEGVPGPARRKVGWNRAVETLNLVWGRSAGAAGITVFRLCMVFFVKF